MEKFDINKVNCLVDLHLHLDGAITFDNVKDIAVKQGLDLHLSDEEIKDRVSIRGKSNNLVEFLSKFELAKSLLQTEIGIKHATINLINELKNNGLMYAEIRFAPQLLTQNGLSQKQVLEAVLDGINACDFDVNLILCCMRYDNNKQENIETIKLASAYLNKGVCAIDLAGAESIYPVDLYKYVFDLANELNIPYVIHAGEDDGPISVINSLKYEPVRIGHGVRANEDKELLDEIAKSQIPLEMCPTSNIMTSIFSDISEYPLREFLNKKVFVTINTDDPAIENTNLRLEYQKLIDTFNLSKDEVKQLIHNSIEASFAKDELKQKLYAKLEKEFNE